MKSLVVGYLAAGMSVAAAAPHAQGADWRWTVEAVVDTVSVANVAVSADGSSIVFTRSRWRAEDAPPGPGYANLWRVPFEGGDPERLTTADADDQNVQFSPDGSRIAFLSKRGTDKEAKTRLYVLPARGGEAAAVTDERTDVTAYAWSSDGKSLAYVATEPKSEEKQKQEKAGKDWRVVDQELHPRRLFVLELASGKITQLASAGDLSVWDLDWAPDSSACIATVTDRNRTDDSFMLKRIVVLPLSGARRDLVPFVGKVGQVAWSRDGRTIAWLGGVDATDPANGSVFVVPATGGAPRDLSGSRQETAQSIWWRPDGRLAVTSVAGTRSNVSLVDPTTGVWRTVVGPEPVVFTKASFSADGGRAAFAGSTSTSPADVYAVSLTAASPARPPKRLASSNPQLDALPRGAQETIHWTAADGLEIEGVLIRPVRFVEGQRSPAIVLVHGGPESQSTDGWLNSYVAPGHALAERGFLVLLPNYRGSTGRGVAYAKADHGDLGGKELTDILDGIEFLASKGWLDRRRVAIMGGSYGGYLTALAVTRFSDRFAAGIDFFGITSWESFLGQSDIPFENSLVHWTLWCYEHAGLCRERSALGQLEHAATPTLILQGQEDKRVPQAQSDELYAALTWKKVPVEYVVYPREEHGFKERWHRIDALTRLLGWIERYVGGGA